MKHPNSSEVPYLLPLFFWTKVVVQAILGSMYQLGNSEAYAAWSREQDSVSAADTVVIRVCVETLVLKPKFSLVLIPSGHVAPDLLAGLQTQAYPNFEVFAPAAWMDVWDDPRGVALDEPDCVLFYNKALNQARGVFIIAVPSDAIIPPHALFEFANMLQADTEVELLFSDEDKVDVNRNRCDPYFKTAWDPDLMLGRDGVGHLAALRTESVRAIGGMRPSGDAVGAAVAHYDLVLRLGWRAMPTAIRHIPAVLCHRSTLSQATWNAKAARGVVRRHLGEIGIIGATVEPAPLLARCNRIRHPLQHPAPKVSILVPTRDHADMLARCAEGLLQRTDYPAFELLIIDNDSREPATIRLFARLQRDPRVRVLPCPGAFNFSALNNAAVAQATGDVLLLLNSDTDVIDPGWLTEMVSHAIRPDIGAVGAKLLYADGLVQHCGIIVGPGRNLGHQLRRSERGDPGPAGELALVRSMSAVTGACLAMRKSVYLEVGGLDETNFPVTFNDIDLCLRLADYGYRVICTPFAEMFHLESASRGYDDTAEKQAEGHRHTAVFQRLWQPLLKHDPYRNPNVVYLWDTAEYASEPAGCAWRTNPARQLESIPFSICDDGI